MKIIFNIIMLMLESWKRSQAYSTKWKCLVEARLGQVFTEWNEYNVNIAFIGQ